MALVSDKAYIAGLDPSAAETRWLCRWYNDDLLLDPYAPLISGRRRFGVRDELEEFEEKASKQAAIHTQLGMIHEK